jgi:cellulose synthase/poly-beta-1,6-N-acetylglucosamine synthase-like glycosyltransferase
MKYDITVLICVHSTNNTHDLLLIKSLKSLENQTYKNFKTLIVLDECWENTKKIISESNVDLDIEIKEKPKRSGLGDAKNFGLSFINTDLVAFLDGDYLYCHDKLEKQLIFLKNDNSIDFLATQSWNIKNNDERRLVESCFSLGTNETHDEIREKIVQENVLTHGSMMIRKKCLDELGGYVNIKGVEDWDLWKRAINMGYKFHQIQERLYIYRIGTSNVR